MKILEEIKAIEAYAEAHREELITRIKEAGVDSVKYEGISQHVVAYVEESGVTLWVLPEYADDIQMRRTDGKNPYIIYTTKCDDSEEVCDKGDGTYAEEEEDILAELDAMMDWKEEEAAVYEALEEYKREAREQV